MASAKPEQEQIQHWQVQVLHLRAEQSRLHEPASAATTATLTKTFRLDPLLLVLLAKE